MFVLETTILLTLLYGRHFRVFNFYSNKGKVKSFLIFTALTPVSTQLRLGKARTPLATLYHMAGENCFMFVFLLRAAHHKPCCSQVGYLTGLKSHLNCSFSSLDFYLPLDPAHERSFSGCLSTSSKIQHIHSY